MSLRGVIGDWKSNLVSCGAPSFEWRIHNFSSLDCEVGDFYQNLFFRACDGLWFFRIYPKGISQNPPSEWASLFLIRSDTGAPKTLHVTIGIEGEENRKKRLQEFSHDDDACCWRRFCRISKLKERTARLMSFGVLTITLEMRDVAPPITRGLFSPIQRFSSIPLFRDASNQTDDEIRDTDAHSDGSHKVDKQGLEKLSEDIGKLLFDRNNGDVTVHVGNATFKVHSFILSVRSQVLWAMLKHEIAERACKRIRIRDCELDVFRDFLQYLYTGSVQSLTERNVFGLYRVADRYLADDLKRMCLNHIKDTLSVRTLCDALKLALTLDEADLLEQATSFAQENFQSVTCSLEWKMFKLEYPKEANKIFIECFRTTPR